MYYSYHNRNLYRIKKGELVSIMPSNRAGYAFILIFKTPPIERPIKVLSAHLYDDYIKS